MAQPLGSDVVVLGGANLDYLVRADRLPGPGETVQGDAFQEAPGGKGANQVVAAARLGSRVAFVGRVGDDARGEAVRARLAQEGVDVRELHRDPEAQTGVALIMVDGRGEKQILVAPGANMRFDDRDLEAATPLIRSSRVLLVQLELPVEVVERAARLARESGAMVVLDAAPPRPLSDELVTQLTVVRANTGEAQAITGVEVRDFDSARKAAEILVRRGAATAIVGAGGDGDLILSPEGEQRLRPYDVPGVDRTGAGDAFAAAIATAASEGWPWKDAGPWASAAAALKTTRLGAQAGLPRREEVIEFLERHGISLSARASVSRPRP